ncbi:MAG: hypothetical protein GY798_04205 [Hyphomicrobiales bacterium]|nr:hypothetical protein [Hyphomicrobiales bacterium]
MKSGRSWNIEVDDEAREAALQAAREAGQSVTDWLSGAIADRAARTPGVGSEEFTALRRLAALVEDLSQTAAHRRDVPVRQAMERQAGPEGRDPTLDETIEVLKARVSALAEGLEQRSTLALNTRPDAGLRDRLDALIGSPAEGPSGQDPDRIRRIEQRLSNIAARLAGAEPNPAGPQRPGRKAVIDRATGPGDTSDGRKMGADPAETIDALRSKIETLAAQLPGPSGGHPVDPLYGSGDSTGPHDPAQKRDVLERIRRELESLGVSGEAAQGEAKMPPRVDDARREPPDRDRLDTLAQEVSALRDALEADDSPRAIARIEMQVSKLARSVEISLGASKSASDAAAVGVAAALADIRGALEDLVVAHGTGPDATAVAGLADNLAEIRSAIEETSVGGSRDEMAVLEDMAVAIDEIGSQLAARDATGPIEAAVSRLEDRLEDVTARLDRFLLDEPTGTIDGIGEQLAAIADGIDALTLQAVQPGDLDALKAEIDTIRHEVSDQGRLDDLEAQVHELATRVDAAASADADAGQLAELETRIAGLAAEVERVAAGSNAAARVEEQLDRLHTHLSADREKVIGEARAAAEAAVRDLTDDHDEAFRQSLRRDLEALRLAVTERNEESEKRIGALRDVLASVVERLARLEEASPEPAVRTVATGTFGPGSAVSSVRPPAVESPVDGPPAAKDTKADLAALRELAAGTAEGRSVPADRRADFIAAARRAAQSAAREMEDTVDDSIGEASPKASPFARIGQAIRNRKKALLLVAAAAVLAIGALQFSGPRVGAGGDLARQISSPAPAVDAVETQPADHAPPPAVPQVDEAALVAPPTDPRTAMNLATAKPVADRFNAAFGKLNRAPAAQVTSATVDAPLTGPASLRVAAASGDPLAAFATANRFAEGLGVAKDLAAAAFWYRRAAENGVAVAQYRLASLLERGRGVTKDIDGAMGWYRRAAEQGNLGAMHNLAVLISEDRERADSTAESLKWFRAAANRGVTDSQYNLGVIFARGLGSAPDLAEAYKWFAVAASQGDADAAVRRDEVAALLKPDRLDAVRRVVEAWRPQDAVSEANSVDAFPEGWDEDGDGIDAADRMALVVKIQSLLADNGYYRGPADGVDGPKTREAVRAFQRSMGVAATGQIDSTLVTALARDAG